MGKIRGRLYVLVYTLRNEVMRVISLRKANKREVKRYEQYFQN
ncbi:MAG: BrnT family toxin [Pelistega sp.]|nr:BrnT family toxin [Pelistega sp.]